MLKELEPLAAQYARSRATMLRAVHELEPEQLDDCLPGRTWSVRDTMVHLLTNEQLMLSLLRDIADGGATSLPPDFDNQKFNEEQVALASKKHAPQIEKELEASYQELMAFLESLTSDQLNLRGVHPAVGDSYLKDFFVAMYAHHEVHVRDIVDQCRRLKRSSA